MPSVLLLRLLDFGFCPGWAFLSLCPTGLPPLQQWLLSPTIGVSALLLPVFWLNRAGLPVKDFGVWLVVVLMAISGLIVWLKRPDSPQKDLLIAGLILLGGLGVCGMADVPLWFRLVELLQR